MDHPSDRPTSDSRPRPEHRWSVLATATIASWVAGLALWFFINVAWTWLWVGVLGLVVILTAASVGLTVGWATRSLIRGRPLLGLAIVGIATLVALVTFRVPWEDAYSRVWFALHHDAFVRVEQAVRSGALLPEPDGYGWILPPDLAAISINGRLSSTGVWNTEDGPSGCEGPIEFAPAAIGTPDGGVGFVHLPCTTPPIGFAVNGFDDAIIPRIRLGDGWWWADGRVP